MIIFLFLIIIVFIFSSFGGKYIYNFLLNVNSIQKIRDIGPKTHLKKAGTITMGGIIFIVPILLISLYFLPYLLIPFLGMTMYGILGFYDDLEKRIIKKEIGLSIKKKLSLQILIGFIMSFISWNFNEKKGIIGFSNNFTIHLEFFNYFIFFVIYFVGITNSFNLTDGLDGLLISVTIPILIAFSFISFFQGNYYLIYFLILIITVLLSFLKFNIYPAKVFMGDTGSLFLGALIAGLAIVLNIELLMIIFGFVYIIETISVIFQVSFFKIFKGKRLFKMAPLHHHFELTGKKESEIVILFTILSSLASFVACIIYWMY